MWPESSSANAVNLVKKSATVQDNSRDIEFFLGDYFFGAPCRERESMQILVCWNDTVRCNQYYRNRVTGVIRDTTTSGQNSLPRWHVSRIPIQTHLGGIAESYMSYYRSLICPSVWVCVRMSSVTLVHPAKAGGRNEMPFGRETRVIPSNIVLFHGRRRSVV